jgi:hypothetical protein
MECIVAERQETGVREPGSVSEYHAVEKGIRALVNMAAG